MASMRKSYFLVPSWDISPAEISLGSIIANVKSPQRALSATTLLSHIDIPTPESIQEKSFSGTSRRTAESTVGLFATFINVITFGGQLSTTSTSTTQVDYSCGTVETRRFTPSLDYITKATEDVGVKEYLKMGGSRARVFMITGMKVASDITITTMEERGKATTAQIGIDIPVASMTVGPKGSHETSHHDTNTRSIGGPIVFAFQVEKLRVNKKGKASSKEYIDGAMLSRTGRVTGDLIIERAGEGLDDDEIEDFDLELRPGLDDETGDACHIIVP